jgi:hypothetical protein
MPEYGADVVAIAATTSGVTGTISVPAGAHLRTLSWAFVETANTADVITIIELTWANAPTPLRFTPNAWACNVGTTVTGGQITMVADENLAIPLDVIVANATVITVKVTTTGNLAVKIGVEWD